jgi:dihydroneopterin aldolase
MVEQTQKSSYQLLETLAAALMETIFESPKISYGKVCIKKPRALRPALVSVVFEKSR